MGVHTVSLTIRMEGETQINNITTSVADAVAVSNFKAGIVTVFVKHTTASVMIIEDEPGIRADTKTFWDRLVPPDPRWQHNTVNPGEDNGHSHLRGQLQGPSVTWLRPRCARRSMLPSGASRWVPSMTALKGNHAS
ncbi:MAG: YjbQ family protein [Nitrospirota bacterium]